MHNEQTESIELSASLVQNLRDRAEASGFDSSEEYIEHILKVVLNELEPIEATETGMDEAEIRSRLESLGYLDQ